MFGAKAAYLHGRCQLIFFAKQDPWRGVLICTEREQQPSLIKEFPSLSPHPVVAKWLYLPEITDDFESTAQRLVMLVQRRDPRIGVKGTPKKNKTGGRESKA